MTEPTTYDRTYRPAPLNPELAWRVRDVIVQNPEHHNQDSWVDGPLFPSWENWGDTEPRDTRVSADEVLASCDTTACVGGWTVLLSGCTIDGDGYLYEPDGQLSLLSVAEKARRLLGLTVPEELQLFHGHNNAAVPGLIEKIFGPDPRTVAV